jgi:hypothetical protein
MTWKRFPAHERCTDALRFKNSGGPVGLGEAERADILPLSSAAFAN